MMIDNVFWSIVIRSALMGLQLMFAGVFIGVIFVWMGHKKYKTWMILLLAFALAFSFSLCFFFIRYLGGY